MSYCLDGSYCCASNDTSCCSNGGGRLGIFYGNGAEVPSETGSLSSYYQGLHISTKSRSPSPKTGYATSEAGTYSKGVCDTGLLLISTRNFIDIPTTAIGQ